jgi:hypothetical protein
MDADPECSVCNVRRTLVKVKAVANRHEMRSFECPQCSSVLAIVAKRQRGPLNATHLHCFAEAAS